MKSYEALDRLEAARAALERLGCKELAAGLDEVGDWIDAEVSFKLTQHEELRRVILEIIE